MARFDITQVRINVAGGQPFFVEAHCTTRSERLNEVVNVSLGSIAVYAYDLAAVRRFATAWRAAIGFAPRVVPEVAASTAGPDEDRKHAGLILRVAGAISPYRVIGIPAGASPNGVPHVRVELGRLVVHAFDAAAIRSWTRAWDDAEKLALRLWPERDAFDLAEERERAQIARTGRARTPRKDA